MKDHRPLMMENTIVRSKKKKRKRRKDDNSEEEESRVSIKDDVDCNTIGDGCENMVSSAITGENTCSEDNKVDVAENETFVWRDKKNKDKDKDKKKKKKKEKKNASKDIASDDDDVIATCLNDKEKTDKKDKKTPKQKNKETNKFSKKRKREYDESEETNDDSSRVNTSTTRKIEHHQKSHKDRVTTRLTGDTGSSIFNGGEALSSFDVAGAFRSHFLAIEERRRSEAAKGDGGSSLSFGVEDLVENLVHVKMNKRSIYKILESSGLQGVILQLYKDDNNGEDHDNDVGSGNILIQSIIYSLLDRKATDVALKVWKWINAEGFTDENKILKKTISFSNVYLAIFDTNKHWFNALTFYDKIKAKKTPLDGWTYAFMLAIATKGSGNSEENFKRAMGVYADMIAHKDVLVGKIKGYDAGIGGNTGGVTKGVRMAFNVALWCCEKALDCEKAKEVWDAMGKVLGDKERDEVSYAALVSAYGKCGRWESALDLLQQMKQAGFGVNVVAYTATISALSKGLHWKKALALFLEIERSNQTPTIVTYNATMTSLLQGMQWERALDLFDEMKHLQLPVSVVSYGTAISACGKGGQWQQCLQYLSEMSERNIPKNVVIYGAAISCMEKSNRLDLALQLMDRMKEEDIAPNAHVYNSVILACAQVNKDEKGYELFREMESACVKPDIVTYNAIIDVVHLSKPQLGLTIFKEGLARGIYQHISHTNNSKSIRLDLHFLSLGSGKIAVGWWLEECVLPKLTVEEDFEALKYIAIVFGQGKSRLDCDIGKNDMCLRILAILRHMNLRTKEYGQVKWFDIEKGFGFIIPENGNDDEVFVHQTSILNANGVQPLAQGEEVQFEIVEEDGGRRKAVNVKKIENQRNRGRIEINKHDLRNWLQTNIGGVKFDREGFHNLLVKVEKEASSSSSGGGGNKIISVAVQMERPREGAPRKDNFTEGIEEAGSEIHSAALTTLNTEYDRRVVGGRIVSNVSTHSNRANNSNQRQGGTNDQNGVTLLLFYQYIEPILSEHSFQTLLNLVTTTGEQYSLTGRIRIAREGLNCTLTGSYSNIRSWCRSLRHFGGNDGAKNFADTEFKITDSLPPTTSFPKLQIMPVNEIVNYGLNGKGGALIPNITEYGGKHLEPKEYHRKVSEPDTVIIDVRNHYEASIGHFQPPTSGAQYIDPEIRKSTEFPLWLDKPSTKEQLRGKQVLMYCTGGVRCERASALLKTKMDKEADTKALGIKGVYQLQGGIDKYLREYPDGGFWRGSNFLFDRRVSQVPEKCGARINNSLAVADNISFKDDATLPMGRCESCKKPWDRYTGKRRCPTCGVPSLICRDCQKAVDKGKLKLDTVRCELCIKEGIKSKRQIREKESKEMEAYERKLRQTYQFKVQPRIQNRYTSSVTSSPSSQPTPCLNASNNTGHVTRIFIKNMCKNRMTKEKLCEIVDGITHIKWLKDKVTCEWFGAVFLEMATPEHATAAVEKVNGRVIYGRDIKIAYAPVQPNQRWPDYYTEKI